MIAHDDRWHFEFDSHSGGRTCPFSPAITRSMPRNPRHAARLRQKHGGHIGSNLGVVELTVALHRVFDSPRDRFIFDVSHQSYVHKMLTGRAEAYLDQSRFDEVTGFTNPLESNMIPLCSAIPALRFLWPAVLPKPAICSARRRRKHYRQCYRHYRRWIPEFGHCVRGAEQCGRTGR